MLDERVDWREAVRAIAWRMAREDYPAASLAALRRLAPARPDGAAFWWLVAEHAPAAFDDERAAMALAVVVQAMAIAHPFHMSSSGKRPLGRALAEAEVNEARLLRLLHTGRDQLPDEIRRLARLMASKGEDGRLDWPDVFDLLFWPDSERTRLQVAKDFYRATYKMAQEKGTAA